MIVVRIATIVEVEGAGVVLVMEAVVEVILVLEGIKRDNIQLYIVAVVVVVVVVMEKVLMVCM